MAGGWSKQMGVEWHLKVESKGLEIESLIWSTGAGGDGICQGERLRKAGESEEGTHSSILPLPSRLIKRIMWTVQIKLKLTNEFYTLKVGNCPEETLSQKFNLCLNPIGPILSKDF